MFQKTGNNPNKPKDVYENELIYIPESKQKINTDLSQHQYFHNFIEPDYNISSQFAIRSRDDKRFQTRVDLLLERETEMRQGTFNPLIYKQHIENNTPQNNIQTPSKETFNNPPRYVTNYPKTPANQNNKPLNYLNLNNSDNIRRDNRMSSPPIYNTNLKNIYYQNNHTSNTTPVVKYNNSLFTNAEKNVICDFNLSQNDIDPLGLLSKEKYTVGSLFNKYKSLSNIYSTQNPLHNKIKKSLVQLLLIIQKSKN